MCTINLNTDCIYLGHLASNDRSLQENSQSENPYYCSHIINVRLNTMEKEKTYPGQIGMLKLSIVMYIGMAVHSSLLVYEGFVLFTFDCAYCMPWANMP